MTLIRTLLAIGLIATALIPSFAQSDTSDPRDLRFIEVTKDVHLAFRPEPLRYWVEGNVTIIFNACGMADRVADNNKPVRLA